jgi:hypothetical protein
MEKERCVEPRGTMRQRGVGLDSRFYLCDDDVNETPPSGRVVGSCGSGGCGESDKIIAKISSMSSERMTKMT